MGWGIVEHKNESNFQKIYLTSMYNNVQYKENKLENML